MLSSSVRRRWTSEPFRRYCCAKSCCCQVRRAVNGRRQPTGVRHPDHPGVFALGVECDGFMYHSSPAARDRDRLRGEVLTGLGWRLHRIWGTAWYRNRGQEEERLAHAISAALQAPISGRLTTPGDWLTASHIEVTPTAPATAHDWTTPYRIAVVPRLPRWVEPSAADSNFDMTGPIEAV